MRSSACTSSTPRTRGSSTSRSPGARAKLVGGDSGRYERETFVDEVLLAPSERAVVDVLFDTPGEVQLEHRTPITRYDLGAFTCRRRPRRQGRVDLRDVARRPGADGRASGDPARPRTAAGQGARLLLADATPLRRSGRRVVLRLPDASGGHILRARDVSEVRHEARPGVEPAAPTSYVCPMHPEVTASEPGTCPECGMKLVPVGNARFEATPAARDWSTAATSTATASSGRT